MHPYELKQDIDTLGKYTDEQIQKAMIRVKDNQSLSQSTTIEILADAIENNPSLKKFLE